ncbi:MAG: TRAP transporter fused permease subunit [Deltaproteobacteria bacterium]|nr:TRAP transporter fused permease subunit [Deltaproteobacteria bacterium]
MPPEKSQKQPPAMTFTFRGLTEGPISGLSVSLCAYISYATIWGPYKTTIVHRAIFLAVMLIIFFNTSKPLGRRRLARGTDLFLTGLTIFSFGYVIVFWERILAAVGATYLTPIKVFVGFCLIALMMESVRRISLPLMGIALAAILYTLLGNYVPGEFGHPGMGFKRFIYLTAFSHEGIFGLGVAVASTYLFMFMLLSKAFQETQASDFFFKLANALVGRTRGGPAKTAVIASGLTGTIIGSSIGNVATTGSITIPMMKRTGYPPHTSGAIEVLASEGAQMMPPIMGAGAFLMAEMTGIPYTDIAWAAVIPAFLYYVSAFVVVDLESVKLGLKGVARPDKIIPVLRQGAQFLIPLAVLTYLLLVARFTAMYAGMVTVLVTIVLNQVRRSSRISTAKVVGIIDKGTRISADIVAMIGCLGIVQQAFTITGLGPRLSDLLISMAGSNVLVLLFMALVVCIILGMGMPTPIAYLLCAVFVAPALVKVGIPEMAAHLFLFYFAIKSGSTPPIAVVAVVAAGIAQANWWKTAWKSFVYSLPGAIIAFAFAFDQSYLMSGPTARIVITSVFGLLGTVGVAAALLGRFLTKLSLWQATLLFVGSGVMMFKGLTGSLIGLTVCLPVLVAQWVSLQGEKKGQVEAERLSQSRTVNHFKGGSS